MGFDDHRVSSRKGRNCVAAGHRKRQGEITRAKHCDWTDGLKHAANIRPGKRLAVRERFVDAGIYPRAFFHNVGEHSDLIERPSALSLQPLGIESRFLRCLDDKVFADPVYLFPNSCQECGDLVWSEEPQRPRRRIG